MPGSSLWLVPPQDSALYNAIQELISTGVPAIFPGTTPPGFFPHITLTSDTFLDDDQKPQEWLDGIPLASSTENLELRIREVEVGFIFFKKVTMRCEKTAELEALAASCRQAGVKDTSAQAAQEWAKEKYLPHCSLMYSELDSAEVERRKPEIEQAVQGGKRADGKCDHAMGGEVWLVPSYLPLAKWKPVARRRLSGINWLWE